jgi:plasmid stabilization system protein ParE
VTGEAADGFARDPVRVRPPTSFLPDISDQNRSARGADVPDLPRVQRNSPEVAGKSGPVFSAVQRSTGTGDEMKTAGLIRTLLTERTTRADIASIEEPHAREGESFVDEAADEALENGVKGSLLGNLYQQPLKGRRPHDEHRNRIIVVTKRYVVLYRNIVESLFIRKLFVFNNLTL